MEASELITSAAELLDNHVVSKKNLPVKFWDKDLSRKLWLPSKVNSTHTIIRASKRKLPALRRKTRKQKIAMKRREKHHMKKKVPDSSKAWFSIKEKTPVTNTSTASSFDLNDYSLLDFSGKTVSSKNGVSGKKPTAKHEKTTRSKMNKSDAKKTGYKTIKFKLFPDNNKKSKVRTKEEQDIINQQKAHIKLLMEQQRWYYNTILNLIYEYYGYNNILRKHEITEEEQENLDRYQEELKQEKTKKNQDKEKIKKLQYQIKDITRSKYERYSESFVRDEILRKYQYVETSLERAPGFNPEKDKQLIIIDFIRDENRNAPPVPYWWAKPSTKTGKAKRNSESMVHSRVPRGAVYKLVSALNSAISNYEGGHIKKFMMHYKSHKHPVSTLTFEDSGYPKAINDIETIYTYNKVGGGRGKMTLTEVMKTAGKRGLEIVYNKDIDEYYLHYPVSREWFAPDDRHHKNRHDSQSGKNQVIALDPGVRKFLVGYDPTKSSVFIGEGASNILAKLLIQVYKAKSQKRSQLLWRRIKGKVVDLHWKSINYLTSNYDTVIYPDFRTAGMVRDNKLSPMIKRLLSIFSFYSFKQRLEYKVTSAGSRLILVNESYTSKTCTVCGNLNESTKEEILQCASCSTIIDRDVNGSRNILLKHIRFTL